MQDVYRQNNQLGDPASLDPQLEDNAQKLDYLQKEVAKYQASDFLIPPAYCQDTSLSYIFYGVSSAEVSCHRRWLLPTTPALTTLLG